MKNFVVLVLTLLLTLPVLAEESCTMKVFACMEAKIAKLQDENNRLKEQSPVAGTWRLAKVTTEDKGQTAIKWTQQRENSNASYFDWQPNQNYILVKKSGYYVISVNASLCRISDKQRVTVELYQNTNRLGYTIVHSHDGDIRGFATGSFSIVSEIEANSKILLRIRESGVCQHPDTFMSIFRLAR